MAGSEAVVMGAITVDERGKTGQATIRKPVRFAGRRGHRHVHRLFRPDVYLVEPSTTQSRVMTALLGQLDVRNVHHFASAAEALARMRDAPPNVVISALSARHVGHRAGPAMRDDAELEHVPLRSGLLRDRPQVLDLVRQSGVCGILPKPFPRHS